MPKYVTLYNWTEQGVMEVRETIKRYQAAKQLAESAGGKLETMLWTIGPYDLSVFRSSRTMRRAPPSLGIAASGNIRTVTMRAFDEDEMRGVVAKIPMVG